MKALKSFLTGIGEPLAMYYRVHAGFLRPATWHHDLVQGGRILGGSDTHCRYKRDNVSIELTFENGYVGNVLYLAIGAPAMPKEYGGIRRRALRYDE